MDFGDRVSWLVEISSPGEFKSSITEFIRHNREGYIIDEDRERGIIKGKARNSRTGEFEEYIISFDRHILTHIAPYLSNPVTQIYEPIPTSEAKERLDNWLNILSVAKSYVDENSFYSDFPGYVSSLSKMIDTLKDLKKRHKAPNSRRKYKEERARNLEPYLKMIKDAGSHEEAVRKLEEEKSEFSWENNHELFFTHAEGINKKQVSIALEKIAKIKWPNQYPSAETIRKALLK